jgi:hypothetical protein
MAIGTGLAILGSSIIGAAASRSGSKKGAKAVKNAEQASLAENQRQFDLVRSDTAPIRALGNAATERLARLYGYGSLATPQAATQADPNNTFATQIRGRILEGRQPQTIDNATGQPVANAPGATAPDMSAFFESPDYQFNLAEGTKAIERSATARGGLLGGGATKDAVRFAQGSASREYGSFVDRLMQQAGLGSNGTAASANAGANSASNVSNISMNAGNARASIYNNNAANVNNAVQGGLQNLLLQRYLGTGSNTGGTFNPTNGWN